MRKMGLILILGGLLLVGAGCGGGGGSGSGSNDSDTLYTIAVNLSYTVDSSSSTKDPVTMTITNIEVKSDKTLKVNCTWKAVNNSGCEKIWKESDANKTTFYIYDKVNNLTYNHTAGTGAAYSDTVLSTTAVSGAYYFPALNSKTASIYFYDDDYKEKLGPITVTGN